jgi:nucleotide-binding universal stress UspA family protein
MPETDRPIVAVGIDGSESSKQPLRWAAKQAKRTGAELVAVTAWHLPEMYGYVSRDYDVDAANLLDRVLKEVLDPPPSARVTPRVVEGRTAPVLIGASKDTDLLVLGTRGHGGFEGMLLGSVSQHCVHDAPCPVVAVPLPKSGSHSRRSTR